MILSPPYTVPKCSRGGSQRTTDACMIFSPLWTVPKCSGRERVKEAPMRAWYFSLFEQFRSVQGEKESKKHRCVHDIFPLLKNSEVFKKRKSQQSTDACMIFSSLWIVPKYSGRGRVKTLIIKTWMSTVTVSPLLIFTLGKYTRCQMYNRCVMTKQEIGFLFSFFLDTKDMNEKTLN